MKSVEYWKRRAETRMYEELEKAEDTAGIIAKVYAKAARYLMDKAEHVFDRFKITECLTKEEALSLIGSLSNVEDTEELIRKLEADGSEEAQETLKRLRNTGAYGSRIQRMGEMLKQVNKIMTSVYGQELKEVTGVLSEIASDSYLKTIYDLQQRINTGFSVAHIDQKRIDKILRMNWSGEHFSKRIWNNTQKLGQTVKEQILEGALTGKTEREMADEIAQEFGKGAKVARRLVRTESCHVSSEVNAEAYEDSDIEMYLYLATLDLRTSEVCRALDGKRFPVSDRQVGENYPPMHPWCRSTTIAIVDEEYLETMQRTYRDPETGRNSKVPLTMSYDEWFKKFVEGNEKIYSSSSRAYKKAINYGQFETFYNPEKGKNTDFIRPQNIIKDLNKSEYGRRALKHIEDNNIEVQLRYNIDNPLDLDGYYDPTDNSIVIYADKTKTIKETSKTLIHEATHSRLGNKNTRKEEVLCFLEEKLHEGIPLTPLLMKTIIKEVNNSAVYKELPWR